MVHDDLGVEVPVGDPVRRVVSLVPSLTEAIASASRDILVGATQWCTHPPDLDVTRVRGTKNPDIRAVVDLRPDLVVANREENRRIDVERLRGAGIPVWVTDIRSVPDAFTSMRRLFAQVLGVAVPNWVDAAESSWAAPSPARPRSAAIAIWRDPWMVVGADTFVDDVATRLGLRNVFGSATDRYPHTTLDEIVARAPDLIVLPDEPYVFTADDGPEAFPGRAVQLVSGRALSWYGPSLGTARDELTDALDISSA